MNKGLNDWAKEIASWRESKKFYTPSTLEDHEERRLMLGKLMLVVTELSEAAEAVRSADFDNFKEEIADTFIRLLDICGTMNIDIESEIDKKMTVNRKRPVIHGRKVDL